MGDIDNTNPPSRPEWDAGTFRLAGVPVGTHTIACGTRNTGLTDGPPHLTSS